MFSNRLRIRAEREIILASGLFDPSWYVGRNPDVTKTFSDPLSHFLHHGASERRDPIALFDTAYYLEQFPELDPLQVNPFCHYLMIGEAGGSRPNRFFDPVHYRNAITRPPPEGVSLLRHYFEFPQPRLVQPSAEFDGAAYLARNEDVAAAGQNPLYHYLSSGQHEQWRFVEAVSGVNGCEMTAESAGAREAVYRVDRAANLSRDDDLLVFVAYSATGRLSALQIEQVDTWSRAGYKVVLCINSGMFDYHIEPGETLADTVIVRQNLGYDFGAWSHVCRIIGGLSDVGSVTFTNDSVIAVGGDSKLSQLNSLVSKSSLDVVFATRNYELKEHLQSYYYYYSRRALEAGALKLLAETAYRTDKDELIHQVEIEFSNQLGVLGLSCGPLFVLDAAEESGANPTIHHWEELLDGDFPFFKVQLLTAGILKRDDPRIEARLGKRLASDLHAHLENRESATSTPRLDPNEEVMRTEYFDRLFNEYDAQTAVNPPDGQVRPILVPLADAPRADSPGVLAVIHCFYLDVAEEILGELAEMDVGFRYLLTTDEDSKAKELRALLRRLQLNGSVVVGQNRGRDVAPFLIEGGKDRGDEELILHLHTKKSPHDSRYAGWAEFLRDNLVGSRDTVNSIYRLFEDDEVGLVYSEHFPEVVDLRNWGYDFDKARRLLQRMGVRITAGMLLDFPTSTMFWARRSVLQPLFDLRLKYEDFDPEEGQVDGTLAHAIERSLLYLTESLGYRHLKVISEANSGHAMGDPIRMNGAELKGLRRRLSARLLGSGVAKGHFSSRVGEVYPVNAAASSAERPRFNLILPTMKPEKIYGGMTTALGAARKLIEALTKEFDLRILITSDDVDAASVEQAAQRLGRTVVLNDPNGDSEGAATIVDLSSNRNAPLSLRRNDVFFATAWWTADLAYRLRGQQGGMFGKTGQVIYLIQDFEPGFYAWSDHYAMADATYRQPDTIAILNSEELAGFMLERYSFADASVVTYVLNEKLASALKSRPKEKIILCYGRPTTARNCFAIIAEGIRRWQERDPRENATWRVVFAGEPFSNALVSDIENAEIAGKLSLEDYSDMLSRAAIGVSLMVSPHPSYPPLEMATAGCVTITNGYEGKDMTKRADNIISLAAVSPDALADALDEAMARVKLGEATPLVKIRDLPAPIAKTDYAAIARIIAQ